jgi:methyl-accepting chemotaxis protein
MRHTIKFKIQVAIAIIIAIVSGVQAWNSISQLRQETTKSINSEMANVSLATSRYISDWLSIRSDMMLANESRIASGENTDRELLVTKHAGQFLSVYAGFSDGTIAYGDKSEDWPADYDPRTRPWYQDAMANSGLVLTEPYQDFDGSIVVSFAKAFRGSRQGVLAADLTVTNLIKQVLSIKLDNNGFAFLVDGNNKIVAYQDEKLSQKPLTELNPQLSAQTMQQLAAADHASQIQWPSRDDQLIYVSKIAGTNWLLGIVVDHGMAYASVSDQITFTSIATLILYVLIALASTWVVNRLLQPLQVLSGALQELSRGEGDLTQRVNIERKDDRVCSSLAAACQRHADCPPNSADEWQNICYHRRERFSGHGGGHDSDSVCTARRQCRDGGATFLHHTYHAFAYTLGLYQAKAEPIRLAWRTGGRDGYRNIGVLRPSLS